MCGFLAWFKIKNSSFIDKKLFLDSLIKQKNRGPDYSNIQVGSDFILGHNRLSIIDNDPRSNQPFTKDGESFLLYNGEIYNLSKLKSLLKSNNIKLSTTSDTEIIYELLINFGIEKTLSLIEGMFSFLFYNEHTKKIIAARDKFGQKPLFIFEDNNDLIFSSSLNSINLIKGSLKLNNDAIKNYIFSQGHITPRQTFFREIVPLYAGHYLIIDDQKRKINRYFLVENLVGNEYLNISDNEAAEELSKILSNSVNEHLNADCKVGILASGGIDSMLINSFARDHKKDITCFTKISSDIEKIPLLVSKTLISDFSIQKIYPKSSDYLSRLIEYIEFGGRPAPWGGGPPLMDLCKRARTMDFKVLLSGDCIDEFSAGYKPSIKTLENFRNDFTKPDHLCVGKYCDNKSSFLSYQFNLRERIMKNMNKSSSQILDYFRINSCQNIEFHLQETNLPHSDTFSMFESIELRNPFLDIELVKFVLNLGIDKIYQNWNNKDKTGKFILKKIAYKKYASKFNEEYFLNKEGTRNYSYFISNLEFWNFKNFLSLEILNLEIPSLDDWKLIFNLINLEIFLNIFLKKESKDVYLKNILSDKGKIELL